jgi:hypothetical protein
LSIVRQNNNELTGILQGIFDPEEDYKFYILDLTRSKAAICYLDEFGKYKI